VPIASVEYCLLWIDVFTFMAVGVVDLSLESLVRHEDNVVGDQLKWGYIHL